MAKTKLNNQKRDDIKRLIKNYISNVFDNDERLKKIQEKEKYFINLAQNEYNRVLNVTNDVINFLTSANLYGSIDVYNLYLQFYEMHLTIQGLYSYNGNFNEEELAPRCKYLENVYSGSTISGKRLIEKYLKSLDGFEDFINDLTDLNDEYIQMLNKMRVIVDNCKYLEDIKEYIPIESVVAYVNQAIYNCNTFISVVTDEDLNTIKNFINNNKNNS